MSGSYLQIQAKSLSSFSGFLTWLASYLKRRDIIAILAAVRVALICGTVGETIKLAIRFLPVKPRDPRFSPLADRQNTKQRLNGVNRQPSNSWKFNRQPSKKGKFYRQPLKNAVAISRHWSNGFKVLQISLFQLLISDCCLSKNIALTGITTCSFHVPKYTHR